MRDSLALARVLSAVAGVEQSTTDGDEGVIIFAILMSVNGIFRSYALPVYCRYSEWFSPLQEAGAVSVHYRDRRWICYTNVIRLNPYKGAVSFMRVVNGSIAPPAAALVH